MKQKCNDYKSPIISWINKEQIEGVSLLEFDVLDFGKKVKEYLNNNKSERVVMTLYHQLFKVTQEIYKVFNDIFIDLGASLNDDKLLQLQLLVVKRYQCLNVMRLLKVLIIMLKIKSF